MLIHLRSIITKASNEDMRISFTLTYGLAKVLNIGNNNSGKFSFKALSEISSLCLLKKLITF